MDGDRGRDGIGGVCLGMDYLVVVVLMLLVGGSVIVLVG